MHAESSNGDDPFAKVKSLISEMISRLENMASADATHKAYCDKSFPRASRKENNLLSSRKRLPNSTISAWKKSMVRRQVVGLADHLFRVPVDDARSCGNDRRLRDGQPHRIATQ